MGKIAFLFAGQGAQFPGMGAALYENNPQARAVFDMAEKLRPGTLEQCFEGTAEELARTEVTQPCLFAMDLACACALEAAGITAQGAAGFSLGEIPAAAFAGMMEREAAFELVMRRGQWMAQCAGENPGGMVAVLRLDADVLEAMCAHREDVFCVNYNAPGQIVAAGSPEGLAALETQVQAAGGRAMRLNVTGAFHSRYMAPAAEKLAEYLAAQEINSPRIPLYANLSAQPYGQQARQWMSAQVQSPVRWEETIKNMVQDGFTTFFEVGAGKTLCGLVKRIDKTARVMNVQEPQDIEKAVDFLEE